MAATAYIDRIDTLSCVERGGAIVSLVRLARVVGLTNTDYNILWTALEEAGIPKIPSALPGTGFEVLVLAERDAKLVENDISVVDVTLTYMHVLEGYQDLGLTGDPLLDATPIYGKMRCSLKQTPTNFYIDHTNPLAVLAGHAEKQITVQHTFPATTDLTLTPPRIKDKLHPGEIVVQGGEVQVTKIQKNFQVNGYMNTNTPWSFVNGIHNTVNSEVWLGEDPGTWLCTEAHYEIATLGRYKMSFEWQHDPDGWDPTAVFIDERTNRPPPGLVADVGYKTIPYYKRVNFDNYFSAIFEGS